MTEHLTIVGFGLLAGQRLRLPVVSRDARFVTLQRGEEYLRFRMRDGQRAGSNGSADSGYTLDEIERKALAEAS